MHPVRQALTTAAVLVAVTALVPAVAAGATRHTYDHEERVVTLVASEADAPVSITVHAFSPFFCFSCPDPYSEARSADGFDEEPDATECSDPDGDSPFTTMRCSDPATRYVITGTSGGESFSTTGNIFNLNAPALEVEALGGDDRITGSFRSDDAAGGDGGDVISLGAGDDSADGGAGDDQIDVSAGSNELDGGDGSDRLQGGTGVDSLAGGAGEDSLFGGAEADALDGGSHRDSLDGGEGNDALAAGDGSDSLSGGGGEDSLDGGEGNDDLDGGDGNDTLSGGAGRDELLPGTGADTVTGGASIDSVSYDGRAEPVTVVLGGGAVSGEPGEGDSIAADVEEAVGGDGGDRLQGSERAEDLDGGAGNDRVEPGGGGDFAAGGDGDDTVVARDGVPDRIDCGAGQDVAVTDGFDVAERCEVIEASRELMPDVDNDGIAHPDDCDDRNPAVRPGVPDRPGDGVDADCLGGDAAFPRVLTGVSSSFRAFARFTRFTRLVAVDLAPGTTIAITCQGGRRLRCPRERTLSFPQGDERASLTSHVRSARIRPGAILEVRVTRPDAIGKLVSFEIRRARRPQSRILCLRPGETLPRDCRSGRVVHPRVLTGVAVKARAGRRRTRLRRLVLRGVPADATVTVRCTRRSRGCPKPRSRSFGRADARVVLTAWVRRARLRPGTTLEISIVRPGTTGKVIRLGIRRGKKPRRRALCVAPEAQRPGRC